MLGSIPTTGNPNTQPLDRNAPTAVILVSSFSGDVMYSNYLRWPVAAPIALVIGVVLMVVGFRLRREH